METKKNLTSLKFKLGKFVDDEAKLYKNNKSINSCCWQKLKQSPGHVFSGVRFSSDDEDREHQEGVQQHQPPSAADRVIEEVNNEFSKLKKMLEYFS